MRRVLAAILLAAAASACADDTPRVKAPIPGTDRSDHGTDGITVDMRLVERLSEATCDREQSCGTVGPGAYFKTREECLGTVRTKLNSQLNPGMCPLGLERHTFEDCVASLAATQCTQPGDEITRSARCPMSDLCMK
jgi:Family of unknown function (DUF6184)